MILNILLTFPISFIYYQIYENFKLTQNIKLANNFTAATHASSTIFFSILYFFGSNNYSTLIQLNSGGYYLYDFYYIIQSYPKKPLPLNGPQKPITASSNIL